MARKAREGIGRTIFGLMAIGALIYACVHFT